MVSLGLASGFIEPLESTSIHLIITGVARLIHLFPFDGISQSLVDQYNATQPRRDRARARLHRPALPRQRARRQRLLEALPRNGVPDSLAERLALFRERAHAWQADGELFRVDSWTHVMLGQGVTPEHFHHLPKAMNDEDLAEFLGRMKADIARAVERLPRHADFLDRYCKASADVWAALATPARSPV